MYLFSVNPFLARHHDLFQFNHPYAFPKISLPFQMHVLNIKHSHNFNLMIIHTIKKMTFSEKIIYLHIYFSGNAKIIEINKKFKIFWNMYIAFFLGLCYGLDFSALSFYPINIILGNRFSNFFDSFPIMIL